MFFCTSAKITIDNICAVNAGHQSKIQPEWRGRRYLLIILICLNYHSVRTKLSLCCFLFFLSRAGKVDWQRGTWCSSRHAASYVVNVKTFFRRRRRRRQKKEKSQSRFCFVPCFYPSVISCMFVIVGETFT